MSLQHNFPTHVEVRLCAARGRGDVIGVDDDKRYSAVINPIAIK